MTIVPIPSGATRQEIIDLAYLGCGMSKGMFGRTPEEYSDALALLNAMMAEWPYSLLGYNMDDDASGNIEDESGVSKSYSGMVADCLCEPLAASIGKELSPRQGAKIKRSYSRLCSIVAAIPEAPYARNTIAGAGNRGLLYRTYLPSD